MSSSTPTPPSAVTPQTEMLALAAQLQAIAQATAQAQALLTNVVLANSIVPVPSFVAGDAITPEALAASIPEDADQQFYWVVLRGREPGLYCTVHAANQQTHRVPGQCMARKTGRAEALAFYAANYPERVQKWVPVPAPVPAASASATDPSAIDIPIDALTEAGGSLGPLLSDASKQHALRSAAFFSSSTMSDPALKLLSDLLYARCTGQPLKPVPTEFDRY
ncbi:hypothetical protein B0H15DRAFT_958224 [Mycena belliarum]|uniref:Uncharacterized protein n=1 Tax=Mycena belliarum TaxID=1033014 RepID=A0AAD6TLC9_9AGAR|nr:hypothetical protein B0H15DRAFT_958224 [Mycena belliae]